MIGALGGSRTHDLSLRRAALYPTELQAPLLPLADKLMEGIPFYIVIAISFLSLVPKGRFELPRPCGHYALNVARLPFRHFGRKNIFTLAHL